MMTEAIQAGLFNLNTKELTPYWIDPNQPLIIPRNPLHWQAHKLQLLMARLDTQAEKNPAQFNSKNYIDALNAYTRCVTLINKGKTSDEVLDAGGMDPESTEQGDTPEMGAGTSDSVGAGISADNPFAG